MTTPSSLVQQQFGANAQRYVASQVHAQGPSLALMVELAEPQPHWLALDVACGGGHSALAVARRAGFVIALDLTRPMLRAARDFARSQEIGNLAWVQGDGGRLPFADDAFHLITCRVALHHFPDPRAAISDWARCLKPGGRLVLVDNIGPEDEAANAYVNAFEKLRDPSHGWMHPPAALAGLLRDAGLRVHCVDILHKPMAFHPWMERMQTPAPDRARLTRMLWESEGPARDFLNPSGRGEDTHFDLWEGVFLAEKPTP